MAQTWGATERLFRDYLLSSGRSPNTARTYVANVYGFWRDCTKYEITPYDADRRVLRSWVSDRLLTVSDSRVHNEMAAIRHFYAWLLEIDHRTDDPTIGIRIKRTKALPTKPLSEEEMMVMLAACECERDRLILLVMGSTGLRISEFAGIKAEDIDWRSGYIKVTGKGNKERIVKPPPEVLNRLHAYVGMFPSGPIWMSRWGRPLAAHQVRKLIYCIGATAKVEDVHPHRLRATFATAFIDEHGDIQALQGVMGHESIETTSKYTEYTKQRRGLAQMSNLDFARRLAAGA